MQHVIGAVAAPSAADVRAFYAKEMRRLAGSSDPRIEHTFKSLRREASCRPTREDLWSEQLHRRPRAQTALLVSEHLIAPYASKGTTTGSRSCMLAGSALSHPNPARRHAISVLGPATTAVLSMWCCEGVLTAYEVDENPRRASTAQPRRFETFSVRLGNGSFGTIKKKI